MKKPCTAVDKVRNFLPILGSIGLKRVILSPFFTVLSNNGLVRKNSNSCIESIIETGSLSRYSWAKFAKDCNAFYSVLGLKPFSLALRLDSLSFETKRDRRATSSLGLQYQMVHIFRAHP